MIFCWRKFGFYLETLRTSTWWTSVYPVNSRSIHFLFTSVCSWVWLDCLMKASSFFFRCLPKLTIINRQWKQCRFVYLSCDNILFMLESKLCSIYFCVHCRRQKLWWKERPSHVYDDNECIHNTANKSVHWFMCLCVFRWWLFLLSTPSFRSSVSLSLAPSFLVSQMLNV